MKVSFLFDQIDSDKKMAQLASESGLSFGLKNNFLECSLLMYLILDTKTTGGDNVVVLNPSKIPSKREFAGKKEYNEVMDSLLW